MNTLELITTSGLTASDGSIITSGATIKFQVVFNIGTIKIKIYPKIYRSVKLFYEGYKNVPINKEILPDDITIDSLTVDEYYNLTTQILYEIVKDWLNNYYGADIVKVETYQQ